MSIIIAVILGGLAGWVASLIVDRNNQMGIVWNILVGIVGAGVANLLIAPLVGVEASVTGFSLSSFLMSVVGATLLLVVFNLITRKRIR